MIVSDNNFVNRSDNNGKSTLHELNKRDKSTSAEKSRKSLTKRWLKMEKTNTDYKQRTWKILAQLSKMCERDGALLISTPLQYWASKQMS